MVSSKLTASPYRPNLIKLTASLCSSDVRKLLKKYIKYENVETVRFYGNYYLFKMISLPIKVIGVQKTITVGHQVKKLVEGLCTLKNKIKFSRVL